MIGKLVRRHSAPVWRLLVCAAILQFAPLAQEAALAHGTGNAAATVRQSFRPGTAAAPVGWSSVISDFDADGAPDIAIADRTNPRGGASYRIEVHLSKGRTQSVSFVSTQGALSITAFDIDNDRDADLVVTPVLSREVVAIWLNDGTGHFDAGDPAAYAPPAAKMSNAANLCGFPDRCVAVTLDRRTPSVAPPVGTAATPIEPRATRFPVLIVPTANRVARVASPRGPPSSSY